MFGLGKKIRKKKGKNALVLGSGAARGLAHIGVIKALREKNIQVDMVIGSSIGALIGACYAIEGAVDKLEEIVLATDWMRLVELADPNLAFVLKGFIRGEKVKDLLKTAIGDVDFRDLKLPLAVTATDLKTGEGVVINSGSVLDAVRASISIPVVFMPAMIRDRLLIDGGVVNPLPVDIARDMGARFIIASNVIQPPPQRRSFTPEQRSEYTGKKNGVLNLLNDRIDAIIKENDEVRRNVKGFIESVRSKMPNIPLGDEEIKNAPNIFETMIMAFYSMEYELVKAMKEKADVLIVPKTGDIASLEFYRAEEAIREGYEAAKKELGDL